MAIRLTFSEPRMVLDTPAYFPNAIHLPNGEVLVNLLWGDDRVPTQDEYDHLYAFDGATAEADWMRFNDEWQADDPSHTHVLASRWARSADGGKTFALAGLPHVLEYAFPADGGVIGLQFYAYHDASGAPIVRSWRSWDNCRSWDKPYDIPLICPPVGNRLMFSHRILPLGGDTYLALAYGRLAGDARDRSMVFRTTDGFRTLHYYATCGMWRPGMEGEYGINETDITRVNDGRLLCVMRNESFLPLYQTHSADDGATWTTPRLFGADGVDPGLITLTNGVTVCTYGRPGVMVAFSENGGDDWQKRTAILMANIEHDGTTRAPQTLYPIRTCSYTDIVECAENTATVFYGGPKSWSDDPKKTPWNTKDRADFRIYAVDIHVEKA